MFKETTSKMDRKGEKIRQEYAKRLEEMNE